MRRTLSFPLGFFLVGLAAAVAAQVDSGRAQEADPVEPAYEIPAAIAERDLELVVARTDDAPVWTGSLPAVAVSLRNRSESSRHSVVTPGDGSMVGWREPHIRYEVQRFGDDGLAAPVATQQIMRCGNYDADWLDEIATLDPGESVAFEHYGPITWIHDLERPGRYRIRGIYSFSRTSSRASQWDGDEEAPVQLGAMAAYAPYELKSAWVEWTAVEPIRVTIVRVEPVVFGVPSSAASVVVARVENVSSETLTIQPEEVSVSIAFTSRSASGISVTADAGTSVDRAPITLEPGDHVPLFGPQGLTSTDLAIVTRRDATASAGTESGGVTSGEFEFRVSVSCPGPRTLLASSDAARLRVVPAE